MSDVDNVLKFRRRLGEAGLVKERAATPIEVALQQALVRGNTTMVMVLALQMLCDIEAAAELLQEGREQDALQVLNEAQWI